MPVFLNFRDKGEINKEDMATLIEFLKSIPYFSGLSPAELDSISKLFFEKTAERGELILLEGESAKALYFVAAGAVKVFKTSGEGKEQILGIVRPGDSFNDVPIFDDGPNPASAQAMGPVVLYEISKSEFATILRDYQQVALNTIKVLAYRERQLVSLVEDLSFRHVIGRVARILLEHAGDGTGPRPRLTQQEMAAMAGTVREVVARSLKTLEEEGAIRLEHHRIVVTDKESLKHMAEASY
ncbi:Crp/Fnr family transcriptional regulator [Chloroflexota bacterium]